MAGGKASLTNSLQFLRSAWLSGAVILPATGAGGSPFWSSFQEANKRQDDQLRQVAAVINRYGPCSSSFRHWPSGSRLVVRRQLKPRDAAGGRTRSARGMRHRSLAADGG